MYKLALITHSFLALTLISAFAQEPQKPNPPAAVQKDTPQRVERPAVPDTASRSRVGDAKELMVGAPDQKFLVDAATSSMAEVELAQLAKRQGSSDAVKQFADRMEKDHSNALNDIKKLASSKNVDLPSELNEKQKAHVAKLTKLNGEAFDRAYARDMVKDHKKAVSMYERQERNAMDSDVKTLASNTLPKLREHLTLAQELNAKK